MNERKLKDVVGIGLVASHIAIVIVAFATYMLAGMDFEELMNLMAAAVPLVAVYTTAVVSYYISNKYRRRGGKKVSGVYAFIALAFPGAYLLFMGALIVIFGFTQRLSFEQLINSFIIVESAFGVYAAKIVQAMFSVEGQTSGQ